MVSHRSHSHSHRSVSHRFSHHATSNMGKQTTLIVLDILMTVSFHCRNEPDTKIKFLAIIFSFILFRPSKFNVRSLSLLRTLLYKTVYQRSSGLTSWYGLTNNSLQHIFLHLPLLPAINLLRPSIHLKF